MEQAKWEGPIRGVAVGVMFCLAYLAAWFNSLDQWFLPAGVRTAALLLMPYRYWPYLLLGDCAALLFLRLPGTAGAREIWAYTSSILLPIFVSLPVAAFKNRFRSLETQEKWLPILAISLAVWGPAHNFLINKFLGGPPSAANLEHFYRLAVGYFLGSLFITLPVMLIVGRKRPMPKPPNFVRDAIFSFATIAAIFLAVVVPEMIGDYLRAGLLLLMLVPMILMTLRHGWRGAALGFVMASLAIAETLYSFNHEGAYDLPVFIVQHALVIASCGLLALGHAISSHYATARELGVAEKEALAASRSSFLIAERILREKALTLEEMQRHIEVERKRVVEHLKAIGDFEGALLLNNEAVAHNSRFGAHVTDLYPLRLERQGLNAVLNSQEFVDARAGGADVLPLLGRDTSVLSIEVQQAAFRCAGNAIDVLSALQPRAYVIKTRVRKGARRCGIALIVTVRDPGPSQSSPRSANAALELDARVKAHGGIVKRRHAHRISLWLPDTEPPVSADQ